MTWLHKENRHMTQTHAWPFATFYGNCRRLCLNTDTWDFIYGLKSVLQLEGMSLKMGKMFKNLEGSSNIIWYIYIFGNLEALMPLDMNGYRNVPPHHQHGLLLCRFSALVSPSPRDLKRYRPRMQPKHLNTSHGKSPFRSALVCMLLFIFCLYFSPELKWWGALFNCSAL